MLKIKPKQLIRLIFSGRLERTVKVLVGLFVIAVFFAGGYMFFHRLFVYISQVQDIGVLLIDKIIAIGFLAFFLMLTISNLISSIGTQYRSAEASFLLASPLEHRQVFWIKFYDTLFYASWATLIITIPALLAYGVIHGLMLKHYIIIAFLIIPPFLIIPAAIGSAFSLIIFPLAHRFGMRKVIAFLVVLSIGATFILMRARFTNILFSAQGDLALLNYYLQELASNDNQFLPSVWIIEALRGARLGNTGDMWFYISMLLSTAAAALVLLDILAVKLYYTAYTASLEIIGRRKRRNRKSFYSLAWRLFGKFPKNMRALFVKDIRLFLRDPNQWSQFTILLVLIVFYLFNLRKIPLNIEGLYWRTLISFVNYAFCGYILATLSVRFVFPSISMEGPSFWAISSSPISVKKLFWEKFWIAFIIFFILAEIVAIISNALLAQSLMMTLLTGGGILLMSISLTSLATGLGSMFPSFDEPNPGKIASSGGGMICALIGLVYVALSTMTLALPTYSYMSFLIGQRATFPATEIVFGFGAMILLNLVATVVPLKLGLRAMEKMEF